MIKTIYCCDITQEMVSRENRSGSLPEFHMCLLRMTVVGEIPSAHSWWWLGSGSRGFWQGLDQVFVEQPQRRQVPGGTNCLEDKLPDGRFVFVCAMMHCAGAYVEPLKGSRYTCLIQGSAMNVHSDECPKGPVVKAPVGYRATFQLLY